MIKRAADACAALGIPDRRAPIVVATSGGADSAAALALIHAARPHARLIACYVDHGIRPAQSIDADIAAVREQARLCDAEVVIERVEARSAAHGSLEAAARKLRYKALAHAAQTHGADWVVTGHHRDDLVETMMLALMRGSGVDGAASMRARRRLADGVTLVRPFLWATKSELAAHAHARQLPSNEDETNIDARFRRNAVRMLIEGLERVAPGSRRALARSADLFAGDKLLLDALTQTAFERSALSAKALRALPTPLLRRVIRYAVKRAAGAEDFHLAHCDAIVRALRSGHGGTFHAGKNAIVRLSAGRLSVQPAQQDEITAEKDSAERPVIFRLPADGKVAKMKTPFGTIAARWCRRPARDSTVLRSDRLLPGATLELRAPRTGDTCIPSGRHTAVSLARFLAKSGYPRDERRSVPLLMWEGRVAAVLGGRVMESFAAKKGRMLAITWRPGR